MAETTGCKAVLSISPSTEAALPGTCPLLLGVLRHPITHPHSHVINSKSSKERATKRDQSNPLLLLGKIFGLKKKICQKLGYIVLETHKNSAKRSGVL